jgi:hypothetical protein
MPDHVFEWEQLHAEAGATLREHAIFGPTHPMPTIAVPALTLLEILNAYYNLKAACAYYKNSKRPPLHITES